MESGFLDHFKVFSATLGDIPCGHTFDFHCAVSSLFGSRESDDGGVWPIHGHPVEHLLSMNLEFNPPLIGKCPTCFAPVALHRLSTLTRNGSSQSMFEGVEEPCSSTVTSGSNGEGNCTNSEDESNGVDFGNISGLSPTSMTRNQYKQDYFTKSDQDDDNVIYLSSDSEQMNDDKDNVIDLSSDTEKDCNDDNERNKDDDDDDDDVVYLGKIPYSSPRHLQVKTETEDDDHDEATRGALKGSFFKSELVNGVENDESDGDDRCDSDFRNPASCKPT